jgi:hypothetical protein
MLPAYFVFFLLLFLGICILQRITPQTTNINHSPICLEIVFTRQQEEEEEEEEEEKDDAEEEACKYIARKLCTNQWTLFSLESEKRF